MIEEIQEINEYFWLLSPFVQTGFANYPFNTCDGHLITAPAFDHFKESSKAIYEGELKSALARILSKKVVTPSKITGIEKIGDIERYCNITFTKESELSYSEDLTGERVKFTAIGRPKISITIKDISFFCRMIIKKKEC